MPTLSTLNPFTALGIGKIGLAMLVLGIAFFICLVVGLGVWWYISRKQLKHTIPLYRKIGSRPFRVAIYKAKDFKIGLAGDKLWYIPKIKKYMPVGTIQDAPNEYPHFEREDGEWINFCLGDIDQDMRKAGVKYIHSDMRSQRIAINNILESRFKEHKGIWEKYGHLITHAIFYMVVAISMVVIFYQYSEVLEKTNQLLAKIIELENLRIEGDVGVVPAIITVFIGGIKKRWQNF